MAIVENTDGHGEGSRGKLILERGIENDSSQRDRSYRTNRALGFIGEIRGGVRGSTRA